MDVNCDLNRLIEYAYKQIKRKMIIFIITDIAGINSISDESYKKLSALHDVMIVNISDASISELDSFDVEQDCYVPYYLWDDEELKNIEQKIQSDLFNEIEQKNRKYKVAMTTIDSQKTIVNDINKLLERRKNEYFR